ncbi:MULTISPECIES: amidohydrolase family protein [unclassified Psychrosphaera]|uniref:amidohydrolase family protein n=1 Tax=unclassified Psychrosphaera TaxID=2641570 RepID=UPI0020900107|nr:MULTISPECIES: amidohydrolase family protein [unclassified Psychrosphaera]
MILISKRSVNRAVLALSLIGSTHAFANDTTEQEKWDVSQPTGEVHTVKIDTTESTWSNLDVHPNGDTIIFDMLGDLYTMPISGGEATPLLVGYDWNMQATYSPDGKKIAFLSDRDGMMNIWVMNADGTEPMQISKETANTIHTPTWSHDGQYIAATRGVMSSRSIAAGEIWIYHHTGGSGSKIKAGSHGAFNQKNITDPKFSPDGKYLYYTQDVTGGRVWQYNKNSTLELFNIIRHDLVTGEEERYIGGAGGAVIPTPSPDGNAMAYLKREDNKTVLYVKDLKSGIDTRLYTEMERDNQETFGTEGNYAYFDWTPDGKQIVFWTNGHFQKISVKDKSVKQIPFHVSVEKKVQQAVRVAVDVAPDEFKVQQIRWATMSPKGDKIVYQALGKLYIRDVKSGKTKRLTKQNKHDEYYPSFSRNGKYIAYTTWDDKKLGTVSIVRSSGGRGKAITTEPGHYIEPRFSPDGDHVIFDRFTGGYLLSPEWSMEPGLYIADVKGKSMKRILKSGHNAHFGADNNQIFYADYQDKSFGTKKKLMTANIDGLEQREVLLGDDITEFRVSPDGKWLGFVYQYNAYIAPFAKLGKVMSIGPKSTWVPVKQASKASASELHWSAKSDTLHWSNAFTLYSRKLTDTFDFIKGAATELPEPTDNGIDLSFTKKADIPESTIALIGADVVTMKDADNQQEVIKNGVVIVSGNRIVAVGKQGDIEIPRGAKTKDLTGYTIVPGLIDAHAHGSQGSNQIIPQQNWKNFSSIAFGVTTIHDPSNDSREIFSAAELQKSGKILAPRIFSTGKILYAAYAPGYTAKIDSLDDARFHIKRTKENGAVSIKSYNHPRRDTRQQVLAAAKELGVNVVPEGGGKLYQNITMVIDGHTTLEHSLNVPKGYSDLTQLWSQTETAYNPTLVVAYGGLTGEYFWYDRTNVWENERLMRYAPRYIIEPTSIRRYKAPDDHYNHFAVASYAKTLRDNGVRVLIGAHGQREGLAAHWEMWMLQQGGFTPWEALRGATFDGAKALGMDKDLGSIENGKLADFAIIKGDVLNDIRQSEMVDYTMINGRLFDTKTMKEVLTGDFEPEQLFFDRLEINAMPAATAQEQEQKSEKYHWSHH